MRSFGVWCAVLVAIVMMGLVASSAERLHHHHDPMHEQQQPQEEGLFSREAARPEEQRAFAEWMRLHGKSYHHDHFLQRFAIWR
jgi:hypothetical protein